jgi:DNA ligase-1
MLAPSGEPDLSALQYPMLASYKLDGVRFLIFDGKLYSRSMEPLHPAVTKHFQPIIDKAKETNVCLDGEIWAPGQPFNKIMHMLAHEELCSQLRLHVFDLLPIEEWYAAKATTRFCERCSRYLNWCESEDSEGNHAVPVKQFLCDDEASVLQRKQEAKEAGHEGLMLKCPESVYVHSRTTAKQNIFWKLKFWDTINAVIIGFTQMQRLTEEAKATNTEKSALGRTKRGHKKADREAVDAIGTVELEVTEGQAFPQGTKFSAGWAAEAFDLRESMTWENRESWIGKHVEIEYQGHGSKDKPRLGRIVRLRPDLD